MQIEFLRFGWQVTPPINREQDRPQQLGDFMENLFYGAAYAAGVDERQSTVDHVGEFGIR